MVFSSSNGVVFEMPEDSRPVEWTGVDSTVAPTGVNPFIWERGSRDRFDV